MPIHPLRISACTIVNALGAGREAALSAWERDRGGLRQCDFPGAELDTWIGRVEGLEDDPLPKQWTPFDCRNNRLARAGLVQAEFADAVDAARIRYGPRRIGVFVGTSTAGIGETERAYRMRSPETGKLPDEFSYRFTHNTYSIADFTRQFLDIGGPCEAVSTSCSSSAKVFAAAYRFMRAGLCDAAVVGGVDSLCLTTLYGFSSLDLVSPHPCRPWDAARDGLNIGEAAGFALLEWAGQDTPGVALIGYGESSDAYHMSSAHPEGAGAVMAMQRALDSAGLEPRVVDYINLHGTATPANDASEDTAVVSLFGTRVPCSSTKGWTGHTLGAAGITEAIFVCLSIEAGIIPGTLHTTDLDPRLSANVIVTGQAQAVDVAMSNSFGFGGTNCSLVFGRIGR